MTQPPQSPSADEVRALVDRLKKSHHRIANMCAKGHGPRMSIPANQDDDDLFICNTINDAIAWLTSRTAPYKCEDCNDTGQMPTGFTSGSDADGNAAEMERCPSCGYGDSPAPEQAEPVVWQMRMRFKAGNREWSKWHLAHSDDLQHLAKFPDCEFRPLYAGPPSSASEGKPDLMAVYAHLVTLRACLNGSGLPDVTIQHYVDAALAALSPDTGGRE